MLTLIEKAELYRQKERNRERDSIAGLLFATQEHKEGFSTQGY